MWQYDGTSDDPLFYWIACRVELNEPKLCLLTLRRSLAQTNGVLTYLEFRWRELNRLDYSIEHCQSFHRAIEKMIPVIVELRHQDLLQQSFPQIDELATLADGAERVLQ